MMGITIAVLAAIVGMSIIASAYAIVLFFKNEDLKMNLDRYKELYEYELELNKSIEKARQA